MFGRKGQQVIKVVVLTSLVWCMLDVWILTYYSGCADNTTPPRSLRVDKSEQEVEESGEVESSTAKSLLNKFIDKVPNGM